MTVINDEEFIKEAIMEHVIDVLTNPWFHAGLLFAAPSIERRLAEKAYDYNKKKSLGEPVKSNWLFDKINRDIDFVKNEAGPLRRGFNKLLMREGPGLMAYSPARLGTTHGKIQKTLEDTVPIGLGGRRDDIKKLMSSDPDIAEAATEQFAKTMHQARNASNKALYGVGAAGLGLAGIYGLAKLKEMSDEKKAREKARYPSPQQS